MKIEDYSFHDSTILEVRETSEQTIDFLIDLCTDCQNNVFEKRILRFKDVVKYHLDEIPFAGRVTILEIVFLGEVKKVYATGNNHFEAVRNQIAMQTNAGSRIIEYADCELVTP